MGLAASQARLLSITARLSDNELRSQQIANSKVRLADSTQEASKEYLAALDATKLMFNSYDAKGNMIQANLTPSLIYQFAELKNQYGIVNTSGQILVNSTDAKNYTASANLEEFLGKYGITKSANPAYATALQNIFGNNVMPPIDEDVLQNISNEVGKLSFSTDDFSTQVKADELNNLVNTSLSGSQSMSNISDSGIYNNMINLLKNPPEIGVINYVTADDITVKPTAPELLSIGNSKFDPINTVKFETTVVDGKSVTRPYYYKLADGTNSVNGTEEEKVYLPTSLNHFYVPSKDGEYVLNKRQLLLAPYPTDYTVQMGNVVDDYKNSLDYDIVSSGKYTLDAKEKEFLPSKYHFAFAATGYLSALERNLAAFIWGGSTKAFNMVGTDSYVSGFATENGDMLSITSSNGFTITREKPDVSECITALTGNKGFSLDINGNVTPNGDMLNAGTKSATVLSTLQNASNILLDDDELEEMKEEYKDCLSGVVNIANMTEKQQRAVSIIKYTEVYNDFKQDVIDLYVNTVAALLYFHHIDEKLDDYSSIWYILNDMSDISSLSYNGKEYSDSDIFYKSQFSTINGLLYLNQYYGINFNLPEGTTPDNPTYQVDTTKINNSIQNKLQTLSAYYSGGENYEGAYDYRYNETQQINAIIESQNAVNESAVLNEWRQTAYEDYYENNYQPALNEYNTKLNKFFTYCTHEAQTEQGRKDKVAELEKWQQRVIATIKSCVSLYKNLPETECFDTTDSKTKWYINLWHRMNGGSEDKSANSNKYYKQLEDNLLNNAEWLKFALEHGVVTLEQVQYAEEDELGSGLKNAKWESKTYNSCSDISTVDDEIAVAKAEAVYQRKLSEIESKDKKYDNDIKKLDTEHNALQTEYESIKSVIDKNAERSFKIFS